MRFATYRPLLAFALSVLTVEIASAAGAYVGGGISRFSLNSAYTSIDGRSASGGTIFGGVEFAPTWSAEFGLSVAPKIDTGPTENIFYPEDSAEYSILRASVRKNFWPLTDQQWSPWLAAGSAYHYINWDTFYYQLQGDGFFISAGVDLPITRGWSFRRYGPDT